MLTRIQRAARTISLPALALLSAGTLSAHVQLDAPNGGETLRAGALFTIKWTEVIHHRSTKNWDLFYSLTGPTGPWHPIVLDLPLATRSFVWNVAITPAVPATHVRVRVVQDMGPGSYDDVSDADLAVLPSLSADTSRIALSSGGVQTIRVAAGAAAARQGYLLLGSYSGTRPGLRIGRFAVRLNPDLYFAATFNVPNAPPLLGSSGLLDARGRATARFVLPPGLPPVLKGLVFHHACVVVSFGPPSIVLVSNAVAVALI